MLHIQTSNPSLAAGHRRSTLKPAFNQRALVASDHVNFSQVSCVIPMEGVTLPLYTSTILKSEAEIPRLVDFIERIFGKFNSDKAEYIKTYTKDFKNNAFIYTTYAKNTNNLIGTATLTKDGYIYSVCVHPEYRRKNIARTMMTGLIKEAQRRNLPKVYLYASNPHAITLYQSLGFQITLNTSNPTEYLMELKLPTKARATLSLKQIFQNTFLKIKRFLNAAYKKFKATLKAQKMNKSSENEPE